MNLHRPTTKKRARRGKQQRRLTLESLEHRNLMTVAFAQTDTVLGGTGADADVVNHSLYGDFCPALESHIRPIAFPPAPTSAHATVLTDAESPLKPPTMSLLGYLPADAVVTYSTLTHPIGKIPPGTVITVTTSVDLDSPSTSNGNQPISSIQGGLPAGETSASRVVVAPIRSLAARATMCSWGAKAETNCTEAITVTNSGEDRTTTTCGAAREMTASMVRPTTTICTDKAETTVSKAGLDATVCTAGTMPTCTRLTPTRRWESTIWPTGKAITRWISQPQRHRQ